MIDNMMLTVALLLVVAAAGSPIVIHKDVNQTSSLNNCTYNGVDFSVMASTTDYTGADLFAYTYKFNICRATVATYYGSDCTSGMLANQLQGTFCTANIATPANPIFEDIDGGVALTYNTGGRICSGTIPSSWRMNFICDEDAPEVPPAGGTTYQVTEPSTCAHEVTMRTSLVCDVAAPVPACGFDGFDFSKLALSDSFYTANNSLANEPAGYHFNICAQVESPLCGQKNDMVVAHQFIRGDPTINCQALGKADKITWSYNSQNHLTATFAGGASCGNITRSFQIVFICSPDEIPIEPYTVVESPACFYTVQVKTQLACRA